MPSTSLALIIYCVLLSAHISVKRVLTARIVSSACNKLYKFAGCDICLTDAEKSLVCKQQRNKNDSYEKSVGHLLFSLLYFTIKQNGRGGKSYSKTCKFYTLVN